MKGDLKNAKIYAQRWIGLINSSWWIKRRWRAWYRVSCLFKNLGGIQRDFGTSMKNLFIRSTGNRFGLGLGGLVPMNNQGSGKRAWITGDSGFDVDPDKVPRLASKLINYSFWLT